jgi:tetrahydromethanopterin S-methyltransferase subunit E
MVMSICGVPLLFCYGFGGALALAGAILGHVARRQVKTRMEAGDGMALAGIIIGWITVAIGIVVVGFLVWAFTHIDEWAPSDPYPYPS